MADLIPYGIQDEQSDIRVHVCVLAKFVYAYPTYTARELLRTSQANYAKKPAWQDGIKTAEGYLVPPDDIPGLRGSRLSDRYWTNYPITMDMNPTEKGEVATQLVAEALRGGRIAFPLYPRIIREYDLQIAGIDILANANVRIQVKCDYAGGHKKYGGTGNLYIQVSEANPHKRH